MATTFNGVVISTLNDSGQITEKLNSPFTISCMKNPKSLLLKLKANDESTSETEVEEVEFARVGNQGCILTQNKETIFMKFKSVHDSNQFHHVLEQFKSGKDSVFEARTDETSAVQYFQFYGYLSQQQNMMQDYIRTSTYQQAMLSNLEDFRNKVVLDVGAGSGILSFFAIQAGAKKVYAVEASSMAVHAENLVNNNKLGEKVVVVPGKIEEISLPEQVDIIISEPMGYMLFNERMLETYLHAKKWLKPNGNMFPTKGDLHIAPFTDETLYTEQCQKTNFWYQESFHGVDLSSLRHAAIKEYFKQPIVDTFDIRICLAKSQKYTVDFLTTNESDLHVINIPLQFQLFKSGIIHGLAFWFDVAFIGQTQTIWLSTSPTEPLTHWYQVRCLLENPIFAKQGQIITGKAVLTANKRQSYDVDIEVTLLETGTTSKNTLDLKNPFFRYTGQPLQAPPGCNTTSPSENYWLQGDQQNTLPNGMMENGLVNGLTDQSLQQQQQQSQHGVYQSNNMMQQPQQQQQQQQNSNLIALGSIPSTGQQQRTSQCVPNVNVPASSIGGGISPSVFSQQQHAVVMGNTSHYPVNNSLMIGDYVTPGNIMMPGQGSPAPAQSSFHH